MSLGPLALDTFSIPRQTQTAGTAIVSGIPPRKRARCKITLLSYASGGTAHTVTYMGELGRTTVTAAVAAAGTSIILAKDPGLYSTNAEWLARGITPSTANNAIAASDYFQVQLADGTWLTATVTSCVTNADGTVTLTVAAIPNAGIVAGATFRFFGVAADTNPHTNAANPTAAPTVSATTTYPNTSGAGGAVVAQSWGIDQGLIIYSNNITAAGTLVEGTAVYAP